MRFVVLLGFLLVAGRLSPFQPNDVEQFAALLIFLGLFDIVDFVMNIIKTFRSK
jgi:hypothetical protein